MLVEGIARFLKITVQPFEIAFLHLASPLQGALASQMPARATPGEMMKKFFLALLALAAALAITPAALADSFNYTFTDGGITASGMLSATEIGNTGVYNATSGTINVNYGGGPLMGSLDTNPADLSPYGADNGLFPLSNAPTKT